MSSEDGEEQAPGKSQVSSEENSVKNLASMFNQSGQGPQLGPPGVAPKPKPSPGMKPSMTPGMKPSMTPGAKPSMTPRAKPSMTPGRLDLDSKLKIIAPGIRPTPFEKPANGTVPPKPSPTGRGPARTSPTAAGPKAPLGGLGGGGMAPMLGPNSSDILNMKSQLKRAPVPKLPPVQAPSQEGFKVELKKSIKKKPPVAPPRMNGGAREPPAEVLEEEAGAGAEGENKENVSTSKSEGDCSSLSSFTSDTSIPRRGSSTSQKAGGPGQAPLLEPLPPLETMGPPPKKPAKPSNVNLPKPAVPQMANKSSLHGRTKEAEPEEEEFGDLYDDVDISNSEQNKRISLIPTMDSDEEEIPEELYDDTEVIQSSPLPPPPSLQTIPPVPQTSGSDDMQEIYDDVSQEGDMEELYEALECDLPERSCPPETQPDSADSIKRDPQPSLPSPKKLLPSASTKTKLEEKQRREQEKQELARRKKEEEMRKKREKEEKKRREKEEKEMKKKFNIKGDIRIIQTVTVTQDCGSDYEKTDLICKRGDRLKVIRRDGNPPGKWLAIDAQGRFGFIDADFVAEEMDAQETYDDVIPCDESGSEDDQEIYEAFD